MGVRARDFRLVNDVVVRPPLAFGSDRLAFRDPFSLQLFGSLECLGYDPNDDILYLGTRSPYLDSYFVRVLLEPSIQA